jgi:sugar lactone lactonase YvrE
MLARRPLSVRSALGALALAAALVLATSGAGSAARAYDARHLFITNRGGGNVLELDPSLRVVRTWFDTEGLRVPNGMAFTPDGSIWVADTGNDRIVAFDVRGVRAGVIDTAARLGTSVESIYFAGDGTLFATANPGLGTIARWRRDATALPDVVSDAAFLNLGNVNLTNEGRVLVSDFSGMGRGIRELDPVTGEVLRTFGTDLRRQEDVMVDGADRVFVSHFDADEVVVFAADRRELYRFTAPAGGPPLARPTGIALSHDCRIFVVSFTNGRLFEFRHRGDVPPEFVRSVEVPGLSQAESLAIAGLKLPGGFNEFAESVPRCDVVDAPDAGVVPDAGPRDAGAPDGAASDGASPIGEDAAAGRDGGGDAGRRATEDPSGCGCRVGARRAAPPGAWATAIGLVVGFARRARRRRRRARRRGGSPRTPSAP